MTNLLKKISDAWDGLNTYNKQKAINSTHTIQFYNWWETQPHNEWFYKFIHNNNLLPDKTTISFCSVFGNRSIFKFVPTCKIIFFTGENVHYSSFEKYSDCALMDDSISLSLGFDYFAHPRYWRFPLWLLYFFAPSIKHNDIAKQCSELRYPSLYTEKRKFACLIARHDSSGLRTEMHSILSKLGNVDCPSKLLHNDNSLYEEYNNNKRMYMNNYMFNICPENSNSYGYVTEKVFEAISSGCIPIYWGSYNNPEPGILNHDAIIFWDRKDGGEKAISQVSELMSSPKLYKEFAMQPRLMPSAEEKIEEMIIGLYNKLKEICG